MDRMCRGWAGVGAGPLDEQLAAHEGLVRLVVRRQQRGRLSFADALHSLFDLPSDVIEALGAPEGTVEEGQW